MLMQKTRLMAILNATPDSFFAASRTIGLEEAIAKGQKMATDGADIIDIGGESTRPGAETVSTEEELKRVIPLIESLAQSLKIPLSIDTMKPKVAAAAIKAGATFINDVGGFQDAAMVEIAAQTKVDICVMHMRGTPGTMQNQPFYEEGIIAHLLRWFEERVEFLTRCGIENQRIFLDPGIGFGKTVADNLLILENLAQLRALGFPILLGVSRKSFLSKITNFPSSELLAATVAANVFALGKGVDILRVHDVNEHRQAIDVFEALSNLSR